MVQQAGKRDQEFDAPTTDNLYAHCDGPLEASLLGGRQRLPRMVTDNSSTSTTELYNYWHFPPAESKPICTLTSSGNLVASHQCWSVHITVLCSTIIVNHILLGTLMNCMQLFSLQLHEVDSKTCSNQHVSWTWIVLDWAVFYVPANTV